MLTHCLPVSALQVVVESPTGSDDLLLQEATRLDLDLAIRLLERLVRIAGASAPRLDELCLADLEILLLLVRFATLGSRVSAEADCAESGCRARVDVSFQIEEYLASEKPRVPRGVEKLKNPAEFGLADVGVKFRLPNASDWRALSRQEITAAQLMRQCVQPEDVSARVRRRVQRAMHLLAPSLTRTMTGKCPECQVAMKFHFDVIQFVLHELRSHASSIFDDVHLLALSYKWTEQDILALPRSRRLRYAAALRGESRSYGRAA